MSTVTEIEAAIEKLPPADITAVGDNDGIQALWLEKSGSQTGLIRVFIVVCDRSVVSDECGLLLCSARHCASSATRFRP
jgi:hypothetical protein